MRSVTTTFEIAEAQAIQQPVVKVLARPNPEALQWSTAYTSTGRLDDRTTGGYYGWRGNSDPFYDEAALYPAGPNNGASCLTPAGTLIRTCGVSTALDSRGPIYVNRVPLATTDANMLTALRVWNRITPSSGTTPKIANRSREAVSADATRSRVFYSRETIDGGGIAYVESTNDGVTWGPETVISTSTPLVGLKALASPHPDLVFVCERLYYAGTNGDPNVTWLQLTALEYGYNPGTGLTQWTRTAHPAPTARIRLDTSTDIAWSGHLQFDATFIDASSKFCVIAFLDDAAGRPATTTYRNRIWSEIRPVEQIDFAEPERDDVIGMRLSKVADKVLLHARRAQGDTDFRATKHTVLYWSVDGLNWSDAYYVGEQSDATWGTPYLWRNALWLIGIDRVWTALPTAFLGGVTALELDVTNVASSITIDEPEDGGIVIASVTLEGELRAYLDHPLLTGGCELEIQAGYSGSELVRLFCGRIDNPTPTVTRDTMTLALTASDYRSNLARGIRSDVVSFPAPSHYRYPFLLEDSVAQVGQLDGEWQWYTSGSEQCIRATKIGQNTFIVSTGEGADARRQYGNDYSFALRVRFDNPASSGVSVGNGLAAGMTARIVWSCAANDESELSAYYELRCGAGITRFELRKNFVVTKDAVGNLLPEPTRYSTLLATSDLAVDMLVNGWMDFKVVQRGSRTLVVYSTFTNPIFDITDYAPLPTSGVVGVRANLATGAPAPDAANQAFASIQVDEIRAWGHDYQFVVEDVMRSLVFRRHLDAVTIAATRDIVFTTGSLAAGWTYVGDITKWSSSTSGLLYQDNSPYKPSGTLRALLSDVGAMQDIVVDLDMTLSTLALGRMGVIARYSGSTYLILTTNQTGTVQLDSVLAGVVVTQTAKSLVPIDTLTRARFRFVFDGSWCSLYVEGLLAATFVDTRVTNAGSVGLSPGLTAGTAGDVHVYQFRIPAFGLGVLPEIEPNRTLEPVFSEIVRAKNATVNVNGRALTIGLPQVVTPLVVVDDTLWKGGGYTRTAEQVATHVRVESEDADGNPVVGTVYSPTVWRQVGVEVWRSEAVQGLRSSSECRDAAWRLLTEQERVARTRSYPVHPQLRWERGDLLTVRNGLDDTNRDLLITGINRTWQRDLDSNALIVAMTARLEEYNATTLIRSQTYLGTDYLT